MVVELEKPWMGRTVTVIRGLEPIPAAFGREVGRALDKSPADRRANVQRQRTDSHLRSV